MWHNFIATSLTKVFTRFLGFGYNVTVYFPRLSISYTNAEDLEPRYSSFSSSPSHTQNTFEKNYPDSSEETDEISSDDHSSLDCKNDDNIELTDIEEIHTRANSQKLRTYLDPKTGFTVFTEYFHLKRGKCCGNKCRHCPYGWENVGILDEDGTVIRKQPKVQSGDKINVQRLLDEIEAGHNVTQSESSVHEICCRGSIGKNEEKERTSSLQRGKGGRKGGTLTSKNVPYTRSGDKGKSMLSNGERRDKDDLAFEAMGTVDELCSLLGVVHAELIIGTNEKDVDYGNLSEWLLDIMSRLFDIGSHIANPKKTSVSPEKDDGDGSIRFRSDGIGGGFDSDHIDILEDCIDVMTEALPELGSFILPTGGRSATTLHVARCVCRRAERRILPLVKLRASDPNAMGYLNRLSDFLFTASRFVNFCESRDEILYKRHFRGSKQRARVTVKLRNDA